MVLPLNWVRKLDRGSFGEVWLARQGERLVAVKKLLDVVPQHLERFFREARILGELRNNPYVVRLIDSDMSASPPYIVMEYCEEGSVRKWVQGPRNWQHAVIALGHAASGLKGIHAQGGFHRDIKPENLLLARVDGKLFVKVADFGLARTPMTATNMTMTFGGTPGYIAPEIYAGHDFHAGADIFSLGVVGIELVTGRKDVEGLKAAQCPDGLKKLLRRMVTAQTSQRPTLQEIADETFSIYAASQGSAPPKPSASPKRGLGWDIGMAFLYFVAAIAKAEEFRAAAIKKPEATPKS